MRLRQLHIVAPWTIFLLVLLSVSAYLVGTDVYELFHKVSLDYNEGWNASHAERYFSGGELYDSDKYLVFNNYPPLSFYIVGLAHLFVDDLIYSGRILSIASLIFVSLCLFLAISGSQRRLLAAGFGAVFFIGFMGAFYGRYVGINDPQMLGHAFGTLGVAIILGRWSSRWRIVIACALLVLAGLVKHNLVALPVALGLFLLFYERRMFPWFLMAGVVLLTTALVGCFAVYGTAFFDELLLSRTYSVKELIRKTAENAGYFLVPIVIVFVYSLLRPADKNVRFSLFYAVSALVFGALSSGGAGVDINAFFDLLIATALGVGLVLAGSSEAFHGADTRLRIVVGILPLLMVSSLLIQALLTGQNPSAVAKRLDARETEVETKIALLRRYEGPVLCEDLAICYWSGKAFEYDPFGAQQAFLTGARSENRLIERFKKKYFGVIQIEIDMSQRTSYFLPQKAVTALLENYKTLDGQLGIFVPRDGYSEGGAAERSAD